MIEIIVDGKTAREKLFDTCDNIKGYKITPKNGEIRKYCKFLKSYYLLNKETNFLDNFFVMEINKKYTKNNYSCISDYEKFLFEFPDEETAFYFKLKYC